MKKFFLVVSFLLLNNYAIARDRVIDCQIDSGNYVVYSGRCLFMPQRGGSFTLAHYRYGKALTSYLSSVNVYIVRRGVAEVRGLTTSGINSRWGEATRSYRDRACWVGDDFRICAW